MQLHFYDTPRSERRIFLIPLVWNKAMRNTTKQQSPLSHPEYCATGDLQTGDASCSTSADVLRALRNATFSVPFDGE
jgi:hypothetical protein